MKKNILTAALLLLLLSSCRVTSEYAPIEITRKGLSIYGVTTDNCISQYLLGLDNILKAEEILSAPYEKQDSLEDIYFPYYKVRQDADSIYLKKFASIAKANTIPFTQIGALRLYRMEGFQMTAECTDDKEYLLQNCALPGATPTVSLKVKVLSENPLGKKSNNSVYAYSVSGTGIYSEYTSQYSYASYFSDTYINGNIKDKEYQIEFTIEDETPLIGFLYPNVYNALFGTFRFYDGRMKMTVSGTALGEERDEIKASLKISSRTADNRLWVDVTISFKDETDTWAI